MNHSPASSLSSSKRSYRACLHCRRLKARCDLGSTDSPHAPPCKACARKGRVCVFAESRRGGRGQVERGRKKTSLSEIETPIQVAPLDSPITTTTSIASSSSVVKPKHQVHHHQQKESRENFATSSLQNPADALEILALASAASVGSKPRDTHTDTERENSSSCQTEDTSTGGIPSFLDTDSVLALFNHFFLHHHPFFPIVPAHRIPASLAQALSFAETEPHLTAAILVVASRHHLPHLHTPLWRHMQSLISALVWGAHAPVGAVEALLLLSENIPRQHYANEHAAASAENRMSWMLVGLAVRIGYMLGLDQKTFIQSPLPDDDNLHRERLAWTFCYIYDRHASIRTGKAFWSRGPGLCFQGAANAGPNPHAAQNFPQLRYIPSVQEDYASMIQALVELTQTMTSAHDLLYPSADRTASLVRLGEYYKFLDEFVRSIDVFRYTWKDKRWKTFPLTELVWINFHYLRLYIFAFAFQAHVQRATPAHGVSSIFPRGPAASPDAKFIFESIDAATEILRICTRDLYPSHALGYLPARFYLSFSYAGVFLLKAVFCRAVVPSDQQDILNLLMRTIMCLASSSPDHHHPAVRYARLLKALMHTFDKSSPNGLSTPAIPASPLAHPADEHHHGSNNIFNNHDTMAISEEQAADQQDNTSNSNGNSNNNGASSPPPWTTTAIRNNVFDDFLVDVPVPDNGFGLYADLFNESDHFWRFVHPSVSA